VGVFKGQFTTDLSILDNNVPQNGSKNEETVPRTRTGYPAKGLLWTTPEGAGGALSTEFGIHKNVTARFDVSHVSNNTFEVAPFSPGSCQGRKQSTFFVV
jgi:hypothetical protein